jgi:type I restriction enzyme R subunit
MSPYNEADTRAKLIDPAIHLRGWTEDLIKREESAPAIDVIDGRPRRRSRGRTDYTLRIAVNADSQPIAIALIEAKAESESPARGLEQGRGYAESKRLNVPFVYSTNGHRYVEYDRFTQTISTPRPIEEFPTPDALRERYERGMGFNLSDPLARPLLQPYPGGDSARRYYQDAAIRAVLEKVAQGKQRALLALATGSGKTRIAVYLLRRIADAGQLRRALFVCDRDELREQAIGAFQNVFGSDAQVVGGGEPQKNARVLVATYQTLNVVNEEDTANFLTENYPENYFSHIIIDECHRSAWSKWSTVLTRNPNAIQVGLTATPRQLQISEKTQATLADDAITADNIKHFGEAVYEYSLTQGIEDGYLAACEIVKSKIDLDNTGITLDDILARKPINANTGEPITRKELEAQYAAPEYEDKILLPDRVLAMTQDLFKHLLTTGGPEQKTIIFCVRDTHADVIATALNNLYSDWCRANGQEIAEHYAFKCTDASSGNDFLPDLRGQLHSRFIATTVELLTTGVDVINVRNIVFFKYVQSPIAFYQMVGRGTRIDPSTNKLMFRVYDYTNASRLFGKEFLTRFSPKPETDLKEEKETYNAKPLQIEVEGFTVNVTDAGRYILAEVDGREVPITIEEYRERLAAKLVENARTLKEFRIRWIDPDRRHSLINQLVSSGLSPTLIRVVDDMNDYDLFDVLGELGYGLNPRTRVERADAFNYKHAKWLATLPANTARTIKAIASQFAHNGTEAIENPAIFELPDVIRAGGLAALKSLGKPADILLDTKQRIFAA